MAKQALGKGLGALISGAAAKPVAPKIATATTANSKHDGELVHKVLLDQVVPSPLQPRKEFQDEQLQELKDSIREHGIIQPLIVRVVDGKHELIAGERRWRASKALGLKEVPVIIRSASDKDVLEMALIENLQRENLNPIEEAQAYERLAKEFQLRQEDIAQRVGKNRATVANTLRLLDLPHGVQNFLRDGRLSMGHAKVLLGLKQEKEIEAASQTVLQKGLTVRATEKLVEQIQNQKEKTVEEPSKEQIDLQVAIKAVEQRMMRHFSTAVSVHHSEKKSRLELDFYGVDDLNRLLALMGIEEEDFGQ